MLSYELHLFTTSISGLPNIIRHSGYALYEYDNVGNLKNIYKVELMPKTVNNGDIVSRIEFITEKVVNIPVFLSLSDYKSQIINMPSENAFEIFNKMKLEADTINFFTNNIIFPAFWDNCNSATSYFASKYIPQYEKNGSEIFNLFADDFLDVFEFNFLDTFVGKDSDFKNISEISSVSQQLSTFYSIVRNDFDLNTVTPSVEYKADGFVLSITDGVTNYIIDDNNNCSIVGTDGKDIVYLGNGHNVVNTLAGNDLIYAGEGENFIHAGEGDDVIYAGKGTTTAFGGEGSDTYVYNPGDGKLIISESVNQDDVDNILIGKGVTSIYRFKQSGEDLALYLKSNDKEPSIIIKGFFSEDKTRIEEFRFAGSSTVIALGKTKLNLYVDDSGEIAFGDGTEFTDTIYGSKTKKNIINANDGNDVIYGGDLDDEIYGGDGDDIIYAYGGNNTIFGGNGNDNINTTDNDDYVDGEAGNDTINAGKGTDTILGGAGNDTIKCLDGGDFIDGGDGDDTINAGAGRGDNLIFGGAGNDRIYLATGLGNSEVYGGGDNDTIDASKAEGYFMLDGGDGNDGILAGIGKTLAYGGEGNDTIVAGKGELRAYGGNGNDVYTYKRGSGLLIVNEENNALAGTDKINFTSYGVDAVKLEDTSFKQIGDDLFIYWKAFPDDLVVIKGFFLEGNNTIEEIYLSGKTFLSRDKITYLVNEGENKCTFTGTKYGEIIFGHQTMDNEINAGKGVDSLVTDRGGDDEVVTGSGNDKIYLGSGNAKVSAGDGNNYIEAGIGNHNIQTGVGNDTIKILSGISNIDAGEGENNIEAVFGNHIIKTGGDDDTIIIKAADTVVSGTTTINAGNGNNNIEAALGNYRIETGVGDDVIKVTGITSGNTIINAGDGNNVIEANWGNITTGKDNDTIVLTNGGIINSGAGNDKILVNGNSNITVNNDGNKDITLSSGTNRINIGTTTSSLENTNVNIDSGESSKNTIYSYNMYGDIDITGNGNNTVNINSGDTNVHLGNGTNTVAARSGGTHEVYCAGGKDTFLMDNSRVATTTIVYNFSNSTNFSTAYVTSYECHSGDLVLKNSYGSQIIFKDAAKYYGLKDGYSSRYAPSKVANYNMQKSYNNIEISVSTDFASSIGSKSDYTANQLIQAMGAFGATSSSISEISIDELNVVDNLIATSLINKVA